MIDVAIPGAGPLRLEHLVLDANGTVTHQGELIAGVVERIRALAGILETHLVSADTFGTAVGVAGTLGVELVRVTTGDDKVADVARLGADRVVAIGNGRNDIGMLRAVRLGIAILGPEGAVPGALDAADVVCRSITDALDMLLDPRELVATLRA